MALGILCRVVKINSISWTHTRGVKADIFYDLFFHGIVLYITFSYVSERESQEISIIVHSVWMASAIKL